MHYKLYLMIASCIDSGFQVLSVGPYIIEAVKVDPAVTDLKPAFNPSGRDIDLAPIAIQTHLTMTETWHPCQTHLAMT